MAANISNKSRKSRNSTSQTPGTGKQAAHRTNTASHGKSRINWFILWSWSVMLVICLAFWAGVIALIIGV